jgi:hypothetical protein
MKEFMKYSKDLSWLSIPAFFIIISMLALHSKKYNHYPQPEKIRSEAIVQAEQKQS